MKQRIKELQFQAAAQIPPLLEASEWQAEFTKKFAELIVRECAKFLDENSGSDQCNNVWYPTPEEMLQHFGFDGMSTEDKKTLIKELLGVKND